MNWYLKALRHFTDFEGRARRKEYWMFVLFNMIFLGIAFVLDNILGITIEGLGYGPFYILYSLFALVPNLAVGVRRLHDTGKSGWMMLIMLIPLVGPIWLLALMVTDGVPGENEFGFNPKEVNETQTEMPSIKSLTIVTNDFTKDSLLLIAILWMFFSRLFWLIIPKLTDYMYDTPWFQPLSIIMDLIWGFIPLMLAFAVRDKTKQLLLFMIGIIYLLVNFFQLVMRFNP